MSKKIILEKSIPESLWSKNVLTPPTIIVDAYVDTLSKYGLLGEAKTGTKEQGIHGGCGDAETKHHYKYRFIASSGRSEISVLGPGKALSEVSNAFLTTFAQGQVIVLDIPGGTGAGALTILATIATLRREKVIPTLPLSVDIVAGDCSSTALDIYQLQLTHLLPSLKSAGIEVNLRIQSWDATRGDSTADLIRTMNNVSSDNHEYLICITNFSGALIDAKLLDDFTPCLEQILSWLGRHKSTLIWLEPAGTKASKKLPQRIGDFIKKRIKWFVESDATNDLSYHMKDPVTSNQFSSSVQIQRFHRV